MNLKALTYQPLPKGAMAGQVAFVVEAGDESCPRLSIPRLLGILKESRATLNPKVPHVRILGPLHTIDPNEALSFVLGLKSLGFGTSAEYDGNMYPPWLSEVNWKIAKISSPEWLHTPAQELWLSLSSTLEEPLVDLQRTPMVLFVDPSGVETKDVFSFLSSARHQWGVLLKTSPSKILLKEVSNENDSAPLGNHTRAELRGLDSLQESDEGDCKHPGRRGELTSSKRGRGKGKGGDS